MIDGHVGKFKHFDALEDTSCTVQLFISVMEFIENLLDDSFAG